MSDCRLHACTPSLPCLVTLPPSRIACLLAAIVSCHFQLQFCPLPHVLPPACPALPCPFHPQFYLVFALASMYIAMLMTGWGSQAGEAKVGGACGGATGGCGKAAGSGQLPQEFCCGHVQPQQHVA